MKKCAFLMATLLIGGCVKVENYHDVIKVPAPAGLVGVWQSQGPQSEMVSPDAIATLVVTKEGDTLDCRQWQRVIAVPGKLMLNRDKLYNVTEKRDIYLIERENNTLEYAGMMLQRVSRPTQECKDFMQAHPLSGSTK